MPAELAVEADPEQPVDPNWVQGRFRLWASGTALGDQDDVVALKAVLGWWRDIVADEQPRWDQRLNGLPAESAFDLLHEAALGNGPWDPAWDALRFSVEQLGMSAFGAYDIFLVDDPRGEQRLLWRHRNSPVQEAVFEPRTVQRVGDAFLSAWAAAGLPL